MNKHELAESLIDELIGSVGLSKNRFTHWLCWSLFRNITSKLAEIGVPFDQKVKTEGLSAASVWCLKYFCKEIQISGQEVIPQDGPLLITSNHPGAYDALVIFSLLKRRDICWVSSEIPFLNLLENTRKHIFFASRKNMENRFSVLRDSIHHLQSGGALVFFGSGHRDPDPAVYSGAPQAIETWLDVIKVFMTRIKDIQLLPVIVSGVVAPQWAHSPVTWLRRKQIDRHRLAEFGQVISQLVHPGRLLVSPAISFGKPVKLGELQKDSDAEKGVMSGLLKHAKNLLQTHIKEFRLAGDQSGE